MKILVFTSSMTDIDFAVLQSESKIKPNPSNQNFYSNLIKCLSLTNDVSVISHRPFTKGMFKTNIMEEEKNKSDNTTYYYTLRKTGKLHKIFREKKIIIKKADDVIADSYLNNFIIVTDTLRVNILKAAIKVSKKYNVKIVGMLTDNPENLSIKNEIYCHKIKKLVKKLDGFLSLTNGLVETFDSTKPNYVFEGLVNTDNHIKKNPIYDYFFFGGSLYERYGVKTLLDGFHKSNVKSKLVIAGSGPLEKYIEKLSKEDNRILYLTQLPKDKILNYERDALANINPRPLNTKLDQESVPSKLIEYLSSGAPTISTKFSKLYSFFKDDVFWIEENTIDSIAKTLENFELLEKTETAKKALSARSKVFEFYGIAVQNESISHFLDSINSSNRD